MSTQSNREIAIELLKIVGLTGLEAELYLLLLEKGPMSTPEISDYLVRHRPQIHVALSRLSSKGFIEELGGRPKKYRAVNPEIMFNIFVQNLNSLARKALTYMKNLSKPVPEERQGVWLIKDPDVARARLANIAREAKTDVIVSGNIRFLGYMASILEELTEKNIRVYVLSYTLGEIASDFLKHDLPFLKHFKEAISGDIVVVADSSIGGLIKSRPTLHPRYGVVVEERALLDYLIHDFVNRWVKGRTIVDEYEQLPVTYTFHRLAIIEAKRLLDKGVKLGLRVRGYNTETGEPIDMVGEIIDAVLEVPAGLAQFRVKSNGQILRVGGLDAVIEEIAGEQFTLYELTGS